MRDGCHSCSGPRTVQGRPLRTLLKGLAVFLGVGLCGPFAPPPLKALGQVLLPTAHAQSTNTKKVPVNRCRYKGQTHDRVIDGVDYGKVEVTLEELPKNAKKGFGARPIRIIGLVIPGLDVGSLDKPPLPSAGLNTDTRPDADSFYMFGLKLGGPDIEANIVPLWSKWPGRAQWEAMENDLLKKANEVAGQNRSPDGKPTKTVMYNVQMFYQNTGDPSLAGLEAWSYPTSIAVTACVADIGAKECGKEFIQPMTYEGAVPH